MLSKSFKAGKCKTSLKLAAARIKLLKNKREVQVKQMRRDLAQLLETGQDQTARIRVEHVIREEKTMSAYDLIELYCELIVARLAIIESQKICPIDLKEAISSIIFASPRCADMPELLDVRKQFVAKYGKDFATSALELRPDCGVNRLIVEKLSAKAPDIETKIKVLTAIAQEHGIKWDPKAFEEQVQKPPEDLLNGPNSFASKTPMESSTVQFPPPHQSTVKPNEKDMERSSAGSNYFSPPASVDTAYQPAPRATGGEYEGGVSRHSYTRDKDASLNRQMWTMEFKDATSAAQAAAESAERASMAARAAAELASRGNDPGYSNRSHESAIHVSKHEAGSSLCSNFQGGYCGRDSIGRGYHMDEPTYAMSPRMHSNLEVECKQAHIKRDSESARSQSRIVPSLSRGSSSEKDATEANQQSSRVGKDDSPVIEGPERHPIRPVPSFSSNHKHDGDVSVSSLHKSDDYTPESFFETETANQDFRSEQTESVDTRQGEIKRKSGKSLSYLSSVSSNYRETIWDSPTHKSDFYQESLGGSGQDINPDGRTHDFNDDASVVFDRSGSDSDDHLEIDNFMGKRDLGSNLQHPETNIRVSSSNLDYSVPEQNSGFRVKDSSNSLLHPVSKVRPEEFSRTISGDKTPSRSDAVTYDVSDRSSSDSENEMGEVTARGHIALNSSHHKQNMGKYELQLSLSKSSPDDVQTSDGLNQLSSSLTAGDTNTQSSFIGGNELNFGRFTGGLRNKGYLRPPYVRSSVVDESLVSEASTGDSSEKPTVPHQDKTAISEDVIKDVHSWKQEFKPNVDSMSGSQNSSDSDRVKAEYLEQRPTFGRRVFGNVALSTSKLDDDGTVDNKQKVSCTLLAPESGELDQKTFHPSPTSAAAYSDRATGNKPLTTAQHRRSRDAAASIISKEKQDDTKMLSYIGKTSDQTDISPKKSPVKIYQGSSSSAIPFFDEENDEDEVLQPRHTVGSLRSRGGRLSQRTRGSKVGQLSDSSGSSHNIKIPDPESKSSESRSSASETHIKPSTSGVKAESNRTSKFLPPNFSIEQHHLQLSETKALAQKDRLQPLPNSLSGSNLSQSDPMRTAIPASNKTMHTSTFVGSATSRESSLKSSHVHPKLPDYETLAAHFHSLRSNRR